jgi:hypothetical protein
MRGMCKSQLQLALLEDRQRFVKVADDVLTLTPLAPGNKVAPQDGADSFVLGCGLYQTQNPLLARRDDAERHHQLDWSRTTKLRAEARATSDHLAAAPAAAATRACTECRDTLDFARPNASEQTPAASYSRLDKPPNTRATKARVLRARRLQLRIGGEWHLDAGPQNPARARRRPGARPCGSDGPSSSTHRSAPLRVHE